MLKIQKKKINNFSWLYVGLLLAFEFLMYMIAPYIGEKANLFGFISISCLIIGYLIYCKKNNNLNYKTFSILIILIGILLRNMYIFKTSIYQRQHDVESLDSNGHLRYIYNLFTTGKLPNTNDWQFYHPPLFHLIGAGWLKFNNILGLSLERGLEGLQIITVIFSSLTMIVSYNIIDKLNIKDKYKLLLNAFMSFYPTFIILSGSINNDCLLTLLQFTIILYLIKWYENTNWINTILLAIFTGLCVMTKLNGAIMAVPIMYVFIKKFIEYFKTDKNKAIKLLYKVIIFGIISLPIGLWYQVRQYILFGGNSVPKPGDFIYIGNYSFFDRFIKISISSLIKIFCEIPGDYNLFSYIIKCSIFGEFSYENISFLHVFMVLTNLLLVIISIIYTIKYVFKKREKNFILNLLFIMWLINMISFYIFNIKYPYICTMDFRYIVPTVFMGAVIIVNNLNIKNNLFNNFIEIVMCVFILLCAVYPFSL